jgi:hypothetical protein
MPRVHRITVLLIAGAIIVSGVSACGSSKPQQTATASANRSEVVAQVGEYPLTRAQVDHWMLHFAGGDYSIVSRNATVPDGLVSDPPDYARCVASLEAAAAKSPLGGAKETGVQLVGKCRQLYQALKTQATSFLVSTQRTIGLGRDLGVTASEAQVQRLFQQAKAREYPTGADLHRYLATKRWTLADVLLQTKLEVLGDAIIKKIHTPQGRAKLSEAERLWTEKTDCKPGYVVEYCKQYKGGASYPSSPPPSVLMEQVTATVTGRCVNLAACAKQVGK